MVLALGGILLLWGLFDLARGTTWLAIPVAKKDYPVVYFFIVFTWILLGGYWLFVGVYL